MSKYENQRDKLKSVYLLSDFGANYISKKPVDFEILLNGQSRVRRFLIQIPLDPTLL